MTLCFSFVFFVVCLNGARVTAVKIVRAYRRSHGDGDIDKFIGPRTFDELVRYFLGWRWYLTTSLFVLIGQMGTLIGYVSRMCRCWSCYSLLNSLLLLYAHACVYVCVCVYVCMCVCVCVSVCVSVSVCV